MKDKRGEKTVNGASTSAEHIPSNSLVNQSGAQTVSPNTDIVWRMESKVAFVNSSPSMRHAVRLTGARALHVRGYMCTASLFLLPVLTTMYPMHDSVRDELPRHARATI